MAIRTPNSGCSCQAPHELGSRLAQVGRRQQVRDHGHAVRPGLDHGAGIDARDPPIATSGRAPPAARGAPGLGPPRGRRAPWSGWDTPDRWRRSPRAARRPTRVGRGCAWKGRSAPRPEQPARLCGWEVILAQVDAIRLQDPRQVGAVVHQQDDPGRSRRLHRLTRQLEYRASVSRFARTCNSPARGSQRGNRVRQRPRASSSRSRIGRGRGGEGGAVPRSGAGGGPSEAAGAP